MSLYVIRDGEVVELDGGYYATELEAYKALAASLKDKAKEAKEEAEAKPAVWKQPFRHACVLYFANGLDLRFLTLRKAFKWAVGERELTMSEEKVYAHATHCYKGGCKNAIRAQFFALRNLVESYKGEMRLVKLERTGRDGYKYTAEAAK